MKRDLEIFRGAGAMAALEAATIRALLNAADIPVRGGRMRIVVTARHYDRAKELVAAAFAKPDTSGRTAPDSLPVVPAPKRAGAAGRAKLARAGS